MSALRAYELLQYVPDIQVRQDAPLARTTSYRIGGPADLDVTVDSYSGLLGTTRVLTREGVPWVILGRGTNVLVADEGYRGCVIRLGREFSRIAVDGNLITAGASVLLARLVNESLSHNLSGLECCVGIPGTVGGALSMDAGSRHDWIGRSVRDVVTFDARSGMHRYAGGQIEWGYRWCSLPPAEIILEATFELKPSTREEVSCEMNRRMARRRSSQPIGRPCCGSVFKNPGDRSAGALLDACNLKGMRVGGACVSEEHANFVINEGGATAEDVVACIGRMHDAVKARFGVDLTPEVKFLGFEG